MSRPWETWGTHDLSAVEREITDRFADMVVVQPQPSKPVTWADVNAAMERIGVALPPRELHCGRAAWEILRNASVKSTDVLGLTASHLNRTGLYGTPVRVDPDMPDGAWKILEGERVVIEGDFAPGHRHAAYVPGARFRSGPAASATTRRPPSTAKTNRPPARTAGPAHATGR